MMTRYVRGIDGRYRPSTVANLGKKPENAHERKGRPYFYCQSYQENAESCNSSMSARVNVHLRSRSHSWVSE